VIFHRPGMITAAHHLVDVYEHCRCRFLVQQQKDNAWTGLRKTADWQNRYFQPASMAFQELDFWLAQR